MISDARLGPMRGRFQPPMRLVAAGLLALIGVLASLQYRWLGRISEAERDRLTATLTSQASALAADLDREITLAYAHFQLDPLVTPGAQAGAGDALAAGVARWRASTRYPCLISEIYVATRHGSGRIRLQHYDPEAGSLAEASWPPRLGEIRDHLAGLPEERDDGAVLIRGVAEAVWDRVPALVVPMPRPFVLRAPSLEAPPGGHPLLHYTVLVLSEDCLSGEILPALASRHFGAGGQASDYQMTVVRVADGAPVYRSHAAHAPAPDAAADARADLFRIRPQEFAQATAEIRRFAAAMRSTAPAGSPGGFGGDRQQVVVHDSRPLSLLIARTVPAGDSPGTAGAPWRLLVRHPAGSLEEAVGSARRRNLLVSSGILGLLAASLVMIVVSTRRSQELARRQLEFVAGVSHELRTPLAVIRAAGDNLADGVIADDAQVRKYGALVRSEGLRLTEMVEQILELSGIHSGQRAFRRAPVALVPLIDEVLRACETLIAAACVDVSVDLPAGLPPVAGDEAALRRVFQNLIGNAIKYGGDGRWIGIEGRRDGAAVTVSIRDRGIGIAPADQARIFEPFYRAADVIAARLQGAGLGLSLVHRIVQAHGGRITVRSAKGAGSEFVVRLPAAAQAPAAAERSGAGLSLAGGPASPADPA